MLDRDEWGFFCRQPPLNRRASGSGLPGSTDNRLRFRASGQRE